MGISYLLPIFIFGVFIISVSSKLPSFSLKKPVTYSMILILLFMLGIFSFKNLLVELMPDVSYGNVTVFIEVRGGMPPKEIERLVSKPVEEAMTTISKMKNIVSTSRKNKSIVTIEFEPGINMNLATMEVREKFMKIKSKLPKEIERPVIAHYEESDAPIIICALTSNKFSPEEMRKTVETKLKDKLLRVEGIANVDIGGGRERKIIVNIDKYKLSTLKIPIKKINNIIDQNNLNMQVGDIEKNTLSYAIRVMGAFRTVEQIENIVIDFTKQGGAVKLKDVAKVEDSYLEADSYARFNSKSAVTVYIQKESMSNTVKVAKNAKQILNDFKTTLDKNIDFVIVSDQSKSIENSIASVEMTILYGAILVIVILSNFLSKLKSTKLFSKILLFILVANLIILYFLGIPLDASRYFVLGLLLVTIFLGFVWFKDIFFSFVVALSIPVSVSITLSFMYFEKLSLNVISLSGLVLGIGLLVDNSIVVLENFERVRKKLVNESLETQLEIAAKEMAYPMIGGTLTTVVVFLPFFLLQKQTQMLYAGIAFTVITSLFASLFCALSLVPWSSSFIVKYLDEIKEKDFSFLDSITQIVKSGLRRLNISNIVGQTFRFAKNYVGQGFSLANRLLYIILALGIFSIYYFMLKTSLDVKIFLSVVTIVLIFGLMMFKYYELALDFFMQKRKYVISLVLVLCVSAMLIFMFKLPKDFMASSEQNEFIIFVELTSGVKLNISDDVVKEVEKKVKSLPQIKDTIKSMSSRVEGWSSKIYVTLVPRGERKLSTEQVIDELRKKLKDIGEKYQTFIYFSEPQTGKEIIVEVYGDDYETLSKLAMSVASKMESIKGFNDIKVRYRPGQPELTVNLDQQKVALIGFDNKDIAESMHAELRGLHASSFYDKTQEIETIVRLDPTQCKSLESLNNLFLITQDGETITPMHISKFEFGTASSEVWHRNKSRVIQVSANTKLSLDKSAKSAKQAMKNVKFPEGYYADIGGDYDDMKESNKSFSYAMIITILLIFIVLASLFESLSQPFIIMITVLLSVIGAVASLCFSSTTVTLGVMVGVLMLSGIVVNNGIMLVDRINILRAKEPARNLNEIIIEASTQRRRPIFMTTFTTVLGLLPMALDRSESSVLWSPLAITVIGGLITSTILTLFVLPCFYVIVENVSEIIKRKFLKNN
jgi:hydrophobic/amphiphilic exporter-1 (mainly G- bacteria), HAE1 family